MVKKLGNENSVSQNSTVINLPESPYNGKSLEELLQIYCDCIEVSEDMTWTRAEIMAILLDIGLKQTTVSSLLGCSPATIREYVRTYRAFPNESMRAKDLSFTHHVYAAKTQEPEKWIDLCVAEGLSTRQLSEKIKAAGCDKEIIEDQLQEKAERTVRMFTEIISSDNNKVIRWLTEKVSTLIMEAQTKAS